MVMRPAIATEEGSGMTCLISVWPRLTTRAKTPLFAMLSASRVVSTNPRDIEKVAGSLTATGPEEVESASATESAAATQLWTSTPGRSVAFSAP